VQQANLEKNPQNPRKPNTPPSNSPLLTNTPANKSLTPTCKGVDSSTLHSSFGSAEKYRSTPAELRPQTSLLSA